MADGLSKKDISMLAFVRVSSGNFLQILVLSSWRNSTVKEEHQLLVPVSFSPLSERCLKIKKGKGYIQSLQLVKLSVKPVPNLLLPESLCCYQEKSYGTVQQIPVHFKIRMIVFWKLFIVSVLRKHVSEHGSMLLMIPLTFGT